MFRFLIAALIVSTASSAFAEGKGARKKRCAAQTEIVSQSVELRLGDKTETDANTTIFEEGGIAKKYAPSISLLVGYIYTLERADLGPNIVEAFHDQCLAHKL